MPTYPLFKFVDAPAVSGGVRYDFNTTIGGGGRAHILPDGYSLGVPQLEGDPDGVGVEYGLRTITLTQRIQGTLANAMAKQSALARELLRTKNWLLVQLASDREPVWFSTYQGDPGDLSFENVTIGNDPRPDMWDIGVQIPAEPFAYGARVTLSALTINNDAVAGSNPLHAVLPDIVGDAPAPLRLSVNPSNGSAMHGYRWMFSLHSGETQRTPTIWNFGTGDGATAGTDTSAASTTGGSAYSGGSFRPVTFATDPGLITRLSGSIGTSLAPGRYKALVRVARSDTTSLFSLRLGQNVGGLGYEYGDTVTTARTLSTGTGHATWVDLGTFSHPKFAPPPGENQGFALTPDVSLQMGRISGGGSANVDVLMFIPLQTTDSIDVRTLFGHFPVIGLGSGGASGVWDGDWERFWAYSSTGAAWPALCEMEGQFPRVTPGESNVLTVLQQANGARPQFGNDASDDITVSTVITPSYFPRWLYVGDG